MKKNLLTTFFLFCIFLFLYSCHKAEKEQLEEKIKETEELFTRARAGNQISEVKGEKEVFVGQVYNYTVSLQNSLSNPTKIQIKSSSDAILLLNHDGLFFREKYIYGKEGTKTFSFSVLVTKPENNVEIFFTSDGPYYPNAEGDFISPNKDTRINCKTPKINFYAPAKVYTNSPFTISTDLLPKINNMQKGHEFIHPNFFRKVSEASGIRGNRDYLTLISHINPGSYEIGVKLWGRYNIKHDINIGRMFMIGEVRVPINVVASGPLPKIMSSVFPSLNVLNEITIQLFEETAFYDKYEWKIPENCKASYNTKRNNAQIKFIKSGTYKFQARGVVEINNKTLYSDWETFTYVHVSQPYTKEKFKISKEYILEYNTFDNTHCGILNTMVPFYFQANDLPYSDFFIEESPSNKTIHYYYIIEGSEKQMQEAVYSDPVSSINLIKRDINTAPETITVQY